MTRTLLIDNYDSFTYNLYQLLGQINGVSPTVIHNDERHWRNDRLADFDNVVISPGPGRPGVPKDLGICADVIRDASLPVLGVCLGLQGICYLHGASVVHAPEPMHGRVSKVIHSGLHILAGIPSPFEVVRYHSLVATNLPPELESLGSTADGLIMAVRHTTMPLWGVQFHPESIQAQFGHRIIENFRRLTHEYNAHQRAARVATSASTLRSESGLARSEHRPNLNPNDSSETPILSVEWRRIPEQATSEAVFSALFAEKNPAFWLDSSKVAKGLSRFSFMGDALGPHAEYLTYDLATKTIRIKTQAGETLERGPLLPFLKRQLARRAVVSEGLPFDFNLGYVGYIGYEMKAECGGQSAHPSRAPDAALLFADRMIAFDHEHHEIYLVALVTPGSRQAALEWMDSTADAIRATHAPAPPGQLGQPVKFRFRHSKRAYLDRILACKEAIRDGESYEVCLTNTASARGRVDVFDTYRRLREISPVPYAALLAFPGVQVLSSSPERFLKIDRTRAVESKPIKGTRGRGVEPAEDERIRRSLQVSEKDRAENLMIVDLVRNDLGAVCELGSVGVPRLFAVETYATVHQLVSTIVGRLRADASCMDCMGASFPGGSMTGAPKVRTMEIIDRLEAGARGVYSGTIGYFSLCGACDLSIVIRTLVACDGEVSMGVGGAIVALSDPETEYEEILIKARAMLEATGGQLLDESLELRSRREDASVGEAIYVRAAK